MVGESRACGAIKCASDRCRCGAPLGALFGGSLRVMGDQVDQLRARLAEVEAERDRWHKMRDAYFWSSGQEQQRANAAETKLAAAQVERDAWEMTARILTGKLHQSDTKLAAVEALCDDPVLDRGGNDAWWVRSVRAAARGEGDR